MPARVKEKPKNMTRPMPALRLLMKHKLVDTHWGNRIVRAELRGKFTDKDREDARNWQTCACGKQDPRIPRTESAYGDSGRPEDYDLFKYGARFHDDGVARQDFLAAAENLIAIEGRACALIAEIEANRKP